ncbi:MAG: glycosyltransferase family 2 protein [Bacillota bacterium]
MSKPLVTIFTLAYNAENYISQTIESVLNQSEYNIEYIIRNNGSTDRTGEICKEYADKDSRITLLYNTINHKKDDGTALEFYEYCVGAKGEYISFLDSDDYLDKDYVKCMYEAAKKHEADIVIGGTNFFLDGMQKPYSQRIPPSVVISQESYIKSEDFEKLYGSLRPLWGKLYKMEFYEKYKIEVLEMSKDITYGGDTGMSLSFLKRANTAVAISSALHYYRVRENSHYHSSILDSRRIEDGAKLFKMGLDLSKHLRIKQEDIIGCLIGVHYNHIKDLFELCFKNKAMTVLEKLNFIENILVDETFNMYNINNENIEFIFSLLVKGCEKIIFNTSTGLQTLSNSFLARLIVGNSHLLENHYSVKLVLLLSAIFDKRNTYLWGRHLLDEISCDLPEWFLDFYKSPTNIQRLIIENKTVFKDLVNCNVDAYNFSEIKASILDAIDNGDPVTANKQLDSILYYRPLDREGIYFKLYTSYLTKDFINVYIMAALGELFWGEDEEVMKIINDIKSL